jgi:FkbM family methyltransferase
MCIGLAARGALKRLDHDTKSIYRSDQWRASSALILREYFLLICETLSPGTFLELGAHAAEASVAYAERVGGHAIAYEANPFTFKDVTTKAGQRGVDVRNLGVGAVNGTLDMQIPLLGDARSVTPVQASFLRRSEHVDYQSVPVEITTLDTIGRELDLSSGVVIWVDVEGLALDVLRGGLSILNSEKCLAVMVEVESINLWEGQARSVAVDDLMTSLDFVPVMRDAEYEHQFNIVYVKRSVLGALDNQISGFWSELSIISFRDPRTKLGRFRAEINVKGRIRRAARVLTGNKINHP